jgi:2-C-methyl-D-erythritol 4-phosphate cytidylyltransferase
MTLQTQAAARRVALIPAAGVGARMGAGTPKQYMAIGGKPMLRHTVDAFLSSELIDHTFVVVSPDDPYIARVLPEHGVTVLRCGGASRMESVRNGLDAIASQLRAHDWVLVHDAARPGLHARLLERLVSQVGDDPVGGLLALPVVDTVKRAGPTVSTLPREGLWLAQTPQMFRYHLLRSALAACTDASVITDDASAVEALGHEPRLVEGHPCNLKVTLPEDIRIAAMYLAAAQPHHEVN